MTAAQAVVAFAPVAQAPPAEVAAAARALDDAWLASASKADLVAWLQRYAPGKALLPYGIKRGVPPVKYSSASKTGMADTIKEVCRATLADAAAAAAAAAADADAAAAMLPAAASTAGDSPPLTDAAATAAVDVTAAPPPPASAHEPAQAADAPIEAPPEARLAVPLALQPSVELADAPLAAADARTAVAPREAAAAATPLEAPAAATPAAEAPASAEAATEPLEAPAAAATAGRAATLFPETAKARQVHPSRVTNASTRTRSRAAMRSQGWIEANSLRTGCFQTSAKLIRSAPPLRAET